MAFETVLSIPELDEYVREVFPQADSLNWKIEHLSNGEIIVSMGVFDENLRPGGTVSGPTMFALADVSAYLLILGHIGKIPLTVTTNLNISFLNKPVPEGLSATCSLLKLGKRLAVCDIRIISGKAKNLVAHATATYSIPPR